MSFETEPNDMTRENTAEDTNNTDTTSPMASSEGVTSTYEDKPRKRRGFAAMDPKLVSELATRGGKAAHRAGTAHEFTSEEARVAGRKGGLATHAKRRARLVGGNGAPPTVS